MQKYNRVFLSNNSELMWHNVQQYGWDIYLNLSIVQIEIYEMNRILIFEVEWTT